MAILTKRELLESGGALGFHNDGEASLAFDKAGTGLRNSRKICDTGPDTERHCTQLGVCMALGRARMCVRGQF